ncbi:hypothetical protein EYC80_010958 [Monilinia laxa]|uniref:Uncharacterized protein n=1 Tax=Monilinia laxa TaxID=61186 RepID=A0A5N6JSL6_MONLA|nr:hypothetical protein EYC80_010958 [Monilinia laxa]
MQQSLTRASRKAGSQGFPGEFGAIKKFQITFTNIVEKCQSTEIHLNRHPFIYIDSHDWAIGSQPQHRRPPPPEQQNIPFSKFTTNTYSGDLGLGTSGTNATVNQTNTNEQSLQPEESRVSYADETAGMSFTDTNSWKMIRNLFNPRSKILVYEAACILLHPMTHGNGRNWAFDVDCSSLISLTGLWNFYGPETGPLCLLCCSAIAMWCSFVGKTLICTYLLFALASLRVNIVF